VPKRAPARRPNRSVVGTLRELLRAAEAGELTAFYGITEHGKADAECVAAGAYDRAQAQQRLADLGEWMATRKR
jgi:antitoxin (DNA-binding transcriptional repressor) of toxin-antitoxin stability system